MRTKFGDGKVLSRELVLSSFPKPCRRVLILTTPELVDIRRGWELGRFRPTTEFVIPEFLPDRFLAIQESWARLGRAMKATFHRSKIEDLSGIGQFDAAWVDSYNTIDQLLPWIRSFLQEQRNISFWATVYRGRRITTARTMEQIASLKIPGVQVMSYHDSSPMTTFGGAWTSAQSRTYSSQETSKSAASQSRSMFASV